MVSVCTSRRSWMSFVFFFFFQAEDGIRDYKVTGVQTCALPIYGEIARELGSSPRAVGQACGANPVPLVVPCHRVLAAGGDRKSTRLNSSHLVISYAVFCLKKKKNGSAFASESPFHTHLTGLTHPFPLSQPP